MDKILKWIISLLIGVLILFLIYYMLFNKVIMLSKNKKDNLIPLDILFGDKGQKSAVSTSPNGKYIAFIAYKNGIRNIWVTSSEGPMLTAKVLIAKNKASGDVLSYFWANDDFIIYKEDNQGDENYRLYSINIHNSNKKLLTPKDNVKANILHSKSNKYKEEILVLLNDRIPEYFDIYRINFITGQKELVYKNNDKFTKFIADDDYNIRIGQKIYSNGESKLFLFTNKQNILEYKYFRTIDIDNLETTNPLHITANGQYLYMIDGTINNTSTLTKTNLSTLDTTIIANDKKVDISNYIFDPVEKEIDVLYWEYLKRKYKTYNKEVEADIKILEKIDPKLEVIISSRSNNDQKWIVSLYSANSVGKFYLFDRKSKKIKYLFSSNNKLQNNLLAKMYPIIIKSRDGLNLVSYLTLPKWLDKGGYLTKPIPLVLVVHGGPQSRNYYRYSPEHQWLANRGYAVLSVNYRGSSGFGKNFLSAGYGEWGRKMQDDLEEGVKWAIQEKITTKDKVVIYGGSYGGYATLVGLTKTPDLYAAGIDIVGISNLNTFFQSIPPYWKPMQSLIEKMLGIAFISKEEKKQLLIDRSPITYTNNITKPLLIAHGANDPRVKKHESEQIVSILKDKSLPVVYLLYPDEGHGFIKIENRLAFYYAAESFLAHVIGGRYSSNNNYYKNSSMKVITGENIISSKTN